MISFLKQHKKTLASFLIFILLFTGMTQVLADETSDEASEEEVIEIPNPIEAETIEELFEQLINALTVIGIALVVLMVVVSGIFMMLGGSNQKNVTKSKNILKWTVIGVFLLLFARAILEMIGFVLG